MARTTGAQTNFTNGEVSPRSLGRFDLAKYPNSVKTLENWLIYQLGGALYRPGTQFTAETKNSSGKARVIEFEFSTEQTYIIEVGDCYMRFYTNSAQLQSGGSPVEITTPYLSSEIFDVHFSQKDDTMYLTHNNHHPRKLTRTSATTFTLVEVPFVRGPFIDTNITATTITPSADTGAAITLTASTAIFELGHIGSYWKIKDGVVKVTGFTSDTVVTGDVQAEPDGTAGDLNTGPGAVTDWAEGAFSDVRGYPATNTFHQQRIYYASTLSDPQFFWGSVTAAFDNFDSETGDDTAAPKFDIVSRKNNRIRWLDSGPDTLQLGTAGGTFGATSGVDETPISGSNVSVKKDTNYGAANIQPERISNAAYYLQRNKFQLRELQFSFLSDNQESDDMNLLADHILRDGQGAVDMAYQQSPNDRIWICRADGQIAVLTRNDAQEVTGWSRVVAGRDAVGAGKFESVAIITQDGADDQIWVVVRRVINGQIKRYVEYFTAENFTDQWDAVRLDSSLTHDSPFTINNATKADPVVISTTAAHGFSNGDFVKIDGIEGMTQINGCIFKVANVTATTFELSDEDDADIDGTAYSTYISGGEVRKMVTALTGLDHLEGEVVSVQTDGGLPSETQTYTVSGGAITLDDSAAVAHVGLPYTGIIRLLKQSNGSIEVAQTKKRRNYLMTLRLYQTLGLKIGKTEDDLLPLAFDLPNKELGKAPPLFTGDHAKRPPSGWSTEDELVIKQDQPLPAFVLAVVMRSEVEEAN